MASESRPKTIILDLDGTVFKHFGRLDLQTTQQAVLLDGVLDKFHEWDRKGYRVVILTGRRESMRQVTESQLASHGLYYDQLVMGVGGGVRVLVNDLKEGSESPTAVAVNVPRNQGLADVSL